GRLVAASYLGGRWRLLQCRREADPTWQAGPCRGARPHRSPVGPPLRVDGSGRLRRPALPGPERNLLSRRVDVHRPAGRDADRLVRTPQRALDDGPVLRVPRPAPDRGTHDVPALPGRPAGPPRDHRRIAVRTD